MIKAAALAFSVTLLVMVFSSAGFNKLRAVEVFEGVVYNFRLLPEAVVRPVAYTLPLIELCVAVSLVVPTLRAYGGMAAAVLLGLFTVAITMNLLRGRREIDCGCFSSDLKQSLNWWLVLRNLLLLSLALWLAGGPSIAAQPVGWITWFAGVAAAIVVAALHTAGVLLSAAAQHAAAHHAAIQTQTGPTTKGMR